MYTKIVVLTFHTYIENRNICSIVQKFVCVYTHKLNMTYKYVDSHFNQKFKLYMFKCISDISLLLILCQIYFCIEYDLFAFLAQDVLCTLYKQT